MRILMLNYEYPPLGGGGGVASANLAQGLAQAGHGVDFITSHFRGLDRAENIEGVRLFREPVIGRKDYQTASVISMLTFPAAAMRRALALRRTRDWDIIHTHFAVPTGPAGYVLSKLWRKPNILSVYGGDIYDPSKKLSPHRHPLLKRMVKAVLNQASAVVGESEDICHRTADLYHPRSVPQRIPLGFKEPVFGPATRAQMGMEEDAIYAVAVGRLVPRKGHRDLLRALSQCREQRLCLIIVGEGPEGTALRSLCGELGLQDRVRFYGQATEDEKYRILSCADFFALATRHEGFGIVFQEAMYCGLPIVTTDEGGQVDFLRHGENALLCAPGDVPALAAALDRLASDAALREAMGRKNRHEIRGHDRDAIVRQYVELYQRTAEQGCRRRGA